MKLNECVLFLDVPLCLTFMTMMNILTLHLLASMFCDQKHVFWSTAHTLDGFVNSRICHLKRLDMRDKENGSQKYENKFKELDELFRYKFWIAVCSVECWKFDFWLRTIPRQCKSKMKFTVQYSSVDAHLSSVFPHFSCVWQIIIFLCDCSMISIETVTILFFLPRFECYLTTCFVLKRV